MVVCRLSALVGGQAEGADDEAPDAERVKQGPGQQSGGHGGRGGYTQGRRQRVGAAHRVGG